jgi:hypothetical protein
MSAIADIRSGGRSLTLLELACELEPTDPGAVMRDRRMKLGLDQKTQATQAVEPLKRHEIMGARIA